MGVAVALNAYLRVVGSKQGEIKGSVTQKGREGRIAVIAMSHDFLSPRDMSTGMASGRREHKPLVVTKEMDRASTGLRTMMIGNETAKDWELQFFRPSATGVETQYFTIRLTNASVTSIGMRMLNNKDPELTKFETYEEIAFVYQKIEWTWIDGSLVAMDDWLAQ
jgi:type VI secretion system secreted protein Hcp